MFTENSSIVMYIFSNITTPERDFLIRGEASPRPSCPIRSCQICTRLAAPPPFHFRLCTLAHYAPPLQSLLLHSNWGAESIMRGLGRPAGADDWPAVHSSVSPANGSLSGACSAQNTLYSTVWALAHRLQRRRVQYSALQRTGRRYDRCFSVKWNASEVQWPHHKQINLEGHKKKKAKRELRLSHEIQSLRSAHALALWPRRALPSKHFAQFGSRPPSRIERIDCECRAAVDYEPLVIALWLPRFIDYAINKRSNECLATGTGGREK